MEVVATREVGPIYLEVLNGDPERGLFVRVTRDIDPDTGWTGVASFLEEMAETVKERVGRIESDNDLEDLLREFGDEETWAEFQEFRAAYGI
jgi:hypothetical protein